LKVKEEERDLGVIMHKSAKPSRQCAEASKRANLIMLSDYMYISMH